MNREIAWTFAKEWLDAWNRHDMHEIMKHYADDIEFCSPIVQNVLGIESGIVQGKENLQDYFTRQLQKFNTLHFQLLDVFTSPQTVVLYYKINRGLLAAEVMMLNPEMRAYKVFANYDKDHVG